MDEIQNDLKSENSEQKKNLKHTHLSKRKMSFGDNFRKSPTLEDTMKKLKQKKNNDSDDEVGTESPTSPHEEEDEESAEEEDFLPPLTRIRRSGSTSVPLFRQRNKIRTNEKKSNVPKISQQDLEDENEDEQEEKKQIAPSPLSLSLPAPPPSPPQVRKVLRPSPTELQKHNPLARPMTPVPNPAPRETSSNLRLLQNELNRLSGGKRNEQPPTTPQAPASTPSSLPPIPRTSSRTPSPTSKPDKKQLIDDSIVATAKHSGRNINFLCSTCSETRYLFRTITDNGTKWGQETKLINPGQSRLYYTLKDLDPDGMVPEMHYPILLSGDCYASIQVDLTWFPIRPGSKHVVPPDAVRGCTKLTFLCFPNIIQEEKAIYTCEIVPNSHTQVKFITSKKSIALLDEHVAFQVQVFSNAKEVLETNPEIEMDSVSKKITESLWYLDMHVAHLQQDLLRYRLYWVANVNVTLTSITNKM
jgi:hypothetical protein